MKQGKRFDISAVDDSYVIVVPCKSKKARRPLKRCDFERAEAFGLATADVNREQLRAAEFDDFNLSYIEAILCAVAQ